MTHDEKIDRLIEDVAVIKAKLEGVNLPLQCGWHQSQLLELKDIQKEQAKDIEGLKSFKWKAIGFLAAVQFVISIFGTHLQNAIFHSGEHSFTVPSAYSELITNIVK